MKFIAITSLSLIWPLMCFLEWEGRVRLLQCVPGKLPLSLGTLREHCTHARALNMQIPPVFHFVNSKSTWDCVMKKQSASSMLLNSPEVHLQLEAWEIQQLGAKAKWFSHCVFLVAGLGVIANLTPLTIPAMWDEGYTGSYLISRPYIVWP